MIGSIAGLFVLLMIILSIGVSILAVVGAPFAQRFTAGMTPREGLALRFAVVTAACTFALLVIGGVVSATGSGLACPDWPSCYGSFFPRMAGPIFFEHGHRLFATLVGCLTTLNIVLVFRARPAGHPARALAVGAFPLVVMQGVLGGLTVKMKLPPAVTILHLSTAMAFFSVLWWMVFRLRSRTVDFPLAPRVRAAVAGTTLLVYAQIVLGALVRHTNSALVCTAWPFCKDVAATMTPLGAPADDPQIVIHMAHRVLAVLVGIAVVSTSITVLRASAANRAARLLALVAPGLVIVQIFLGMMSVMTAKDVLTVTAHLGVGALLLASMVCMLLASFAVSADVVALEPTAAARGATWTEARA
ncbi:MAG TPA: COX15/CtaA family protein [bacterium]|nr:COX15/CtaA family protein [bacterium]